MASQENKIVASFSSGRGNTLTIPLPDDEIKGTGSRFADVSFAQRVAESLNTIFKNVFKVTYDVFCVEEIILPEPINIKPKVTGSPFTWDNMGISDLITSSDIYLSLNESFNWGLDDVTKGFYEIHTEKMALRTLIININNKKVLGLFGGYIHDSETIYLYDQYAKAGAGIIPGKKRNPFFKDQGGDSQYTLGGVYIHELMYHIYPDDFGKGQKVASTNYLRNYFGLELNEDEDGHFKGKNQRGAQFWKDVRAKNLKTIWKKESNQNK